MMVEPILHRFSEFIAEHMGLSFSPSRLHDLERGMRGAASELGFPDPLRCIEWLMAGPLARREAEVLASHLTVGETYFFREKHSFDLLERRILPELIAARRGSGRRLRVWDAGCSTGEEPYSLALLLQRAIPDYREWEITLLATDMNPRALRKAAEGVYGEWSFRGTPQWVRERCCRRTAENRFTVRDEIREMVTFTYHNVVEDSYPSLLNNLIAMDLILCCNVLMYFTPSRAARVIRNLSRTLVDGGWLVLGPNDPLSVLPPGLARFDRSGATVFQKRPEALMAPPAVPEELPPATPMPTTPPPAPEPLAQAPPPLPVPPEAPTPYDEALALYGLGRYAEAAARLLPSPEDSAAFVLLTKAYANQGKLTEAATWCEKAISADKLRPLHHYLLAMILQEKGDSQGAMAALRRVLYLDQEFVLAHVGLGNLALRLGMLKESRRYFANALSLLAPHPPEEIVPESEGITAGRLREIIESTLRSEEKEDGRAAA